MSFPFWQGNRPFYRRSVRHGRRGQKGGGLSESTKTYRKTMFGLNTFSSVNYMISPTGGGEPGIVTGFGVFALIRIDALTIGNQGIVSRQNTPTNQGYTLYFDILSQLTATMYSGSNAVVTAPIRKFVASDVGKIFLVGLQSTGTAVRCWCDRAATGAGTAISGYSVPTANQTQSIGTINNAVLNPANGTTVLGVFAFTGVPSDAQMQAAYDDARVRGDVPVVVGGGAVTHRWSLKDELKNVSSPAGRKTYGVRGQSTIGSPDRFATAIGAGIPGVGTGFWVSMPYRRDAPTDGQVHVLASYSNATANRGWALWDYGGPIQFVVWDGSGTLYVSSSYNPSLTNYRTAQISGHFTGTSLRLYVDGAQIGIDVAATFAVAPSSETRIGGHAAFRGSQGSVFGLVGGNGNPTAAEFLAHARASESTGLVQAIAGKTDHLWDITRDVVSEVVGVPSVVVDRIGTDHLSRVGFGVQIDANSIRAIGPFGATDGLQTAPGGGIQGSTSGLNFQLDLWLTKIPSGNETPVYGANPAVTTGWYFQLNNAAVRFNVILNGAATVAAIYTLTSADLNKRLRFTGDYGGTGGALRLFLNGVQVGSNVSTVNPYSANAASVTMYVGCLTPGAQNLTSGYIESLQGGNLPLTNSEITALNADLTTPFPSIPGKTLKRYIFEQDIAANSGGFPQKMVERVAGGDDLSRFGTGLELAVDIATAPVCPNQLTDTVTRATVDSLLRVGAPGVVSFDPTTVDGRRMFGAQGFVGQNRIESAVGKGFQGATSGFVVAAEIIFDSIPSGSQLIAHCLELSSANYRGWAIQSAGTVLRCLIGVAAGGVSISGTYTITAADIGQRLQVMLQCQGGKVLRMFVKRVQQGADVVCNFVPETTGVTQIGVLGTPTSQFGVSQPFFSGRIFSLQAVNRNLTLAEIQRCYDDSDKLGRLAPFANGFDRFWDFTQDVIESGDLTTLPTVFKERGGSVADNLTRQGGMQTVTQVTAAGNKTWLRGFDGPATQPNTLQTAPGGGVKSSTTGVYWGSLLVSFETLGATRNLLSAYVTGSVGYAVGIDASNNLRFVPRNRVGAFVLTSPYVVQVSDLNAPMVLHWVATGAVARWYLNGVQVGPDVACVEGIANTSPMYVGNDGSGTVASTGIRFAGFDGADGVAPSAADIATHAAAILAAGKMVAMGGGKSSRTYDFVQDVADAGGVVPTRSKERQNSGDDMVRVGAGLTLAQRVDRAWNNEVTPIITGARNFTLNDRYERVASMGGVVNGFFWNVLMMFETQAVTSRARSLFGNYPGGQGYTLWSYGSHNSIQAVFTNAGGSPVAAPTSSILPADVGKLLSITGVWDSASAKVRLYIKRVEAAAGTAMTGYSPSPSAFRLGEGVGGGANDGCAIYGFQYGVGIPTLSEIQANHDWTMASEDIVSFAGKTTNLYSLKRSAAENNGVLPAEIVDRIGNLHLTKFGSPVVAPQYARAWGW